MVIDAIGLYILILVFSDLDLDPRSQEYEKSLASVTSPRPWSIWIEFDMLLRFVGLVNFIFIWSSFHQYSRKRTYLCNVVRKFLIFMLAYTQTSSDWFFFQTWCLDRDHWILHLLEMTLINIWGHSCMLNNEPFYVHFFQISQWILMKFSVLPQRVSCWSSC